MLYDQVHDLKRCIGLISMGLFDPCFLQSVRGSASVHSPAHDIHVSGGTDLPLGRHSGKLQQSLRDVSTIEQVHGTD